MKMHKIVYILLLLVSISACRKDTIPPYGLGEQTIEPTPWGKDSLKSTEEFVANLHQSLFEEPLPTDELPDILCLASSIGDETLVYDLLFRHYLQNPAIVLPTEATMREHIPNFVADTYLRFLGREPSPTEQEWWVKYIETQTNITPEMVYDAFVTCQEYRFR